jgi:hypothetical protein
MKMTRKIILTATILFLSCFSLFSCKKDKTDSAEEDTFCTLINENNFNATGPLINNFLATLNNESTSESLNKLSTWLENKSCVDTAIVLCNSCIETLPPQSELSIDFISNGQKVNKIMDILMDDTLKFREYH